jgi:hypothetical protein
MSRVGKGMNVSGNDIDYTSFNGRDLLLQWIDALRSGQYKQGKYALFNIGDTTYCCLGVICDLMKIPYVPNVTKLANGSSIPVAGYDLTPWEGEHRSSGMIAEGLARHLGLVEAMSAEELEAARTILLIYSVDGCERQALAQANDHGATFEEIATYLEQVVLPRFDTPSASPQGDGAGV